MLILLSLSLLLSAPQDGRWHISSSDFVEFGLPDTDQRAIWFSCQEGEGLAAGALAHDDPSRGHFTEVMLSGQRRVQAYRGTFTERGDGMNFKTHVSASDDFILTLLAGRPVRVTNGGFTYTVTGEGAPEVLGPYLERCASKSP